jgi:hypothetical protein
MSCEGELLSFNDVRASCILWRRCFVCVHIIFLFVYNGFALTVTSQPRVKWRAQIIPRGRNSRVTTEGEFWCQHKTWRQLQCHKIFYIAILPNKLVTSGCIFRWWYHHICALWPSWVWKYGTIEVEDEPTAMNRKRAEFVFVQIGGWLGWWYYSPIEVL